MKFILEVDIEAGGLKAEPVDELGRILRYWAGNLRHYELVVGDNEAIYDSSYAAVGEWRIVAE